MKKLPWGTPTNPIPWETPTRQPSARVAFVFDERSLEKISDIKEQGFMDPNLIMDMAKANNDVYLTAYSAGQEAGLKASAAVISRLCGAIEDYLDGVTEGNVLGLRQAVAAAEPKFDCGCKDTPECEHESNCPENR